MGRLFSTFALVLSFSAWAKPVPIHFNGIWSDVEITFSGASAAGDFEYSKSSGKVHTEFEAEKPLSSYNRKDDFEYANVFSYLNAKTYSATLRKESDGKLVWHECMSFVDDDGNVTKGQREYEVEFTQGDWDTYQKGDTVELKFTAKGQKLWDEHHQMVIIETAKMIRVHYQTKYKIAIDPVSVDEQGSSGATTLKGDLKQMVVGGSSPYAKTSSNAQL